MTHALIVGSGSKSKAGTETNHSDTRDQQNTTLQVVGAPSPYGDRNGNPTHWL